jgi:hypothetical protein
MNAKLAKTIVKGAASLIVSVAIGYTYKAGKKIDERIDQHFATPEPASDEDN